MSELQGRGLINDEYLKDFMLIHRQKAEDDLAKHERRPAKNLSAPETINEQEVVS